MICATAGRLTKHAPSSSIRRTQIVSITFPGESADYRAARDRLLEQEIELRRAMESVAAARRALPPGGVVAEDYAFQSRPRRRAEHREAVGAVRARQDSLVDLQHDVPPRPRRRPARPDGRPDSAAAARRRPVPVVRGPARPARRRRRARLAAHRLRGRGQGPDRPRCSPSRASAGGDGCGCCLRRAPPTTATTAPRPPRATSARCSTCSTATVTRSATSGAPSSSTPRPTPARIPATSAPSSRSGTCSTLTREGRATDWDEQLSY